MAQPAVLQGMAQIDLFIASATTPFWTPVTNGKITASDATTITNYIANFAEITAGNYDAELPTALSAYFMDTATDTNVINTEQNGIIRVNSGGSKAVADGKQLLAICYTNPLIGANKRNVVAAMCYYGGENVLSTGGDVATLPINLYPVLNGTGADVTIITSLLDTTLVDATSITPSIADKTSSWFGTADLPSS